VRPLRPRYNIAPSQSALVVRLDQEGRREGALLRWGLIPFWAKDEKIAYKTINARAETVASAPAFRAAYRRRRCIVPATGFYEWKRLQRGKQPYRIRPADAPLFGFAGLWESWRAPTGEAIETYTILTTDANELMRELHNRMPVILAPADYGAWLDADHPDAQALLKPCPPERMTAYPVSARVNSPANDDESVIAPVAAQEPGR
jgi:putative SOS response-associated peptidase YedK